MKKVQIIKSFALVGLMAGVVMLSGCGEKVTQLKDMKDDVTSKVESGKKMVDEGKGMMGGLKDAMKNGVAMKCESKGDDWVTYTNGKEMRGEGTEDGASQAMLVTSGVTYTWNTTTKTGFKIDKKCLENFQKDMNAAQGNISEQQYEKDFSFEDLEAEEEAGGIKCSPTTEADFSVPTDVKFEDQCKMMKAQMGEYEEQMKKMQNEIPSM